MFEVLRDNILARKLLSWMSLFGSLGTLVCCAIPSLLVMLGFGATLAGFLGHFPQLIWLSENKEIVFGLSFLMLFLSFLAMRYARSQVCPIELKSDCEATKDWSKPLLWMALIINLIGFFYAFVLPRLMY
jgi:hypothetical protein